MRAGAGVSMLIVFVRDGCRGVWVEPPMIEDEEDATPTTPAAPAPTGRLVLLAALLLIPGATLALGAQPVVGVVICLLFLGVAAFDFYAAWSGSGGPVLRLPDIVRTGRGRPFEIVSKLAAGNGGLRRCSVGLPIPGSAETPARVLDVALPEGGRSTTATWHGTIFERGRYVIDGATVQSPSPLGLWQRRRHHPDPVEIRVYPDLRSERKAMAALFLNRGTDGAHAARQVGKGRDFEQLREYAPGDDYADIDWKATAKRGAPVTRMFQVERTQEVYVLIDHSRLSARPVPGDANGGSQLDRLLIAALTLGLAAESKGDLFGLLTFSSKITKFVRARGGKGHYDTCRDALYTLQPEQVSPDFDELAIFLRTRLTRRALLVVLTDLGDALTAENYAESIALVAKQHLVLTVALKPAAARPLFGAPAQTTEDIYADLAGQFHHDELAELAKVLRRQGVQLAVPDADALTSEVVAKYLQIKGRQIL